MLNNQIIGDYVINYFTTRSMNVKSLNTLMQRPKCNMATALDSSNFELPFCLPFCRAIIRKIKVRLYVVTKSKAERTCERSRRFTRAIICKNSGYLHSRMEGVRSANGNMQFEK